MREVILVTSIILVCFSARVSFAFILGCPVDTQPIGCYNDGIINPRNGRRPMTKTLLDNSNQNPQDSLDTFTCKCATETMKKKYTFFAVKNGAICLSGPPYAVDFDALGDSTACVNKDQSPCGSADDACTGLGESFFVQRVVYEKCNVSFARLGCFHDTMIKPRPLPDYILSGRDKRVSVYEPPSIQWEDWNNWMEYFICRCAQVAKAKGFPLFGLQFYGECWSGTDATQTYARDGSSQNCASYDLVSCKPDDEYCVGRHKTNFIYTIREPCNVEYRQIGCYKDKFWFPPRPIPEMLSTEVDRLHPLNNGHQVMWYTWNTYFPQMICRCAKQTFQRKWDTFGVQNYGECFSGADAVNTYKQDGRSKACVREDFEKCPRGTLNCVGPAAVNYVYSVESCEIEFEVIGCFKDSKKKPRPLPEYIMNDRDPRAKSTFSGRRIDWRHWNNYLSTFVCRCARKAKDLGYSYFGGQFYGECWSGSDAKVDYDRDGESTKCIGLDYKQCEYGGTPCIGTAFHNYVYRIKN